MLQVQEAIRLTAPWAALYNNHPLVQSGVVFAHISGLMVGGGAAVAADRAALRARHADPDGQRRHVEQLRLVHRTVLAALAVVVVSGVLLFAADIETFVASPVFWVKMVLVALLAVNGWVLTRTGQKLETTGVAATAGWRRLTTTSVLSLCLWFLIILIGAVLVSVG